MRGKGGKAGGRNSGVTIIRREEVIEGGHHGGAWKVAYADFVTAMMAFFLLMWLLNATTEDQRKGLADYFSPNNLLSHASSGTGQPFGGHTVFDQGAMVSDRGAVQVIVGKRPVVDDPPDDDADTPLTADRHGAAADAGPAGKLDSGPQGAAKTTPATPGAGHACQVAKPGATGQVAKPGATGPADAAHTSPQAGPIDMSQAAPADMPHAASADMSQAARTNVPADAPLTARTDAPAGAQVVARLETASGTRAPTAADLRAEHERQEKQAFEQAAAQLRQAVRDDPALAAMSRQLAIDITPEGLRIQLLDEDKLAMFATGSATPNDRIQLLLAKVAPVLMRLPEDIAVVGHTDAAPFAGTGKTNWELSTERANATRRLLTGAGLAEARVSRVTGLADRDPLLPADPFAAANRRIAIIVLRGTAKPAEPPAPPSVAPSVAPSDAPLSTPPVNSRAGTPLATPSSALPAVGAPPAQRPVTLPR